MDEKIVNIYCDESCHLENDGEPNMVLGAVSCESIYSRQVIKDIRELKIKHGLSRYWEMKWVKVSPSKLDFFIDVIRYFTNTDCLRFRAVVASKTELDHDRFNQTHDDWIYKMYYELLEKIMTSDSKYRIYIDIKDTRSQIKTQKLKEYLSFRLHDFNKLNTRIQIVRSDEVNIIQLTDLLIGAVVFKNRDNQVSKAKQRVVDEIEKYSGQDLSKTSIIGGKVDIFIWKPRK